jgi:hypothetical protein
LGTFKLRDYFYVPAVIFGNKLLFEKIRALGKGRVFQAALAV